MCGFPSNQAFCARRGGAAALDYPGASIVDVSRAGSSSKQGYRGADESPRYVPPVHEGGVVQGGTRMVSEA